jgi:CRP-like cAMP-binding protein
VTYDEACALCAQRGWLSRVAPGFRDAVLRDSRLRQVAAGTYAYHVGDACDGLWGLVDGVFAIDVAAGDREPETRIIRHPCSWHGETGLVIGAGRVVALRAVSACTVLHLPLHRVTAILSATPEHWRWIALLSAEHSLLAMQYAEDFMVRDSRRRVASVLLRLAGCTGIDAGAPAPVMVSQDDLARITNLSRGILNTILREFEEAGLVRRSYRQIDIDAPERLRRLAQGD